MNEAAPSPEEAYAAFAHRSRFGSLDGLRCFSIAAVLWHHSGIHLSAPLFDRGELGVYLFFAISGFLITTLMIRENRDHGEISLKNFYQRRSLRIFPLYYAVLLAYSGVVLLMERDTAAGREFFGNLPAYATYTSNWFVSVGGGERVIFYFAWSLAVEEQFYLTWPWVQKYLATTLRMALLAGVFAIVIANHAGVLHGWIPEDSLLYRVLSFLAPPILMGIACAHLLHSPRGFAALYGILGQRWAPAVVLAAVVFLAALPAGPLLLVYAIYVGLVALVVSCVVREDHALAALLSWQPMVRVGIVSYGIYLMHLLCFNAVRQAGDLVGLANPWVRLALGSVLVYLVAELSFRTFERFFLNMKARYSHSG